MPTLYTTALSANGRKPLLLDHRLGLGLEVETVNVYLGEGQAAEYRSINPWGKIPTLVDGELTLWESNAILVYLAESYGDYALWAREPRRRADILRWLFWESASWQPALVTALSEPVGRLLRSPGSTERVSADWDDPRLLPLLEQLDRHFSEVRYLIGDEVTLADLSVSTMTMYLRPLDFPWGRFPAFTEWCRRIEATPEWQATAVAPFEG